MIVNPQFFNYRLIIGSLVIAFVILGSFSYSSYSTLKDYQQFIEQEKTLVQNELSEMITQYESVDVQNKSLNQQLVVSKEKISRILDSVKTLKASVSLISRYKAQLRVLKIENEQVLAFIDDLKNENLTLKEQSNLVKSQLKEATQTTQFLESEKAQLTKSNSELKEDLEEAKKLAITNVEALAVKRVTSKKVIGTKYAKRANKMQVSFTIAKNSFVEEGNKDLYIQILDPKSNIVADKGVMNFGKESLIYSQKKSVNYVNEDLEVSTFINTDNDEKLSKGLYFVSIFHDAKRIGKTTIELK